MPPPSSRHKSAPAANGPSCGVRQDRAKPHLVSPACRPGVVHVVAAVEGAKWSKDMREQLKTMQRDVTSLTDHASYLSNKITFALDAMLGVVNLEQNNIIKLFSVMAVVLAAVLPYVFFKWKKWL